MRWVALGVDYEMAGKDLIDSVIQSGKIARALGGRPPEGFNYEMFLDEKGEKISKSKGNGLSIDEWLTYGPDESLAFYIYREPKKAKSLHLGLIPRAVDDYWQFRGNYHGQNAKERLGNPVHHVHNGQVPQDALPVTFGLLLNLVGVMGADATKDQVWGYLGNYLPGAIAADYPELDKLIGYALAYARDFVAPTLVRRAPEGSRSRARAARRRSCRAARGRDAPRTSRTSSTRSARPAASPSCATGSRRCTRRCSGRARGRAWAASSRCTAWRIRAS